MKFEMDLLNLLSYRGSQIVSGERLTEKKKILIWGTYPSRREASPTPGVFNQELG